MSHLLMIAFGSPSTWTARRIPKGLIEGLVAGRYGFQPELVKFNGEDLGHPLNEAVPLLFRRVDSGNLDELTFEPASGTEDLSASMSLTQNPGATSSVSIKIPLAAAAEDIEKIVTIAERLAEDSAAEYLCAHDAEDLGRLHFSREARLFVPGRAKGAFWLTYFCDEYVERLGGNERIREAPAYQARALISGVLLRSHPDPLNMAHEPKRSELSALHEYLTTLAKRFEHEHYR